MLYLSILILLSVKNTYLSQATSPRKASSATNSSYSDNGNYGKDFESTAQGIKNRFSPEESRYDPMVARRKPHDMDILELQNETCNPNTERCDLIFEPVSDEPLISNISTTAGSGSVSVELVGIGELSLTLVKLQITNPDDGNSQQTQFQLQASDDRFTFWDGDTWTILENTDLAPCYKRCRITVVWMYSCTENVIETVSGTNIDILITSTRFTEAKMHISLLGLSKPTRSQLDFKVLVANIVVLENFDDFRTVHRSNAELRNSYFRNETHRNTLLRWRDVINTNRVRKDGVFLVPGFYNVNFDDRTVQNFVPKLTESYPGVQTTFDGLSLYLNATSNPTNPCQKSDQFLIGTEIRQDGGLSVCFDLQLNNSLSQINLIELSTMKIVLKQNKMFLFYLNIEEHYLMDIPSNMITTCYRCRLQSNNTVVLEINVLDLVTNKTQYKREDIDLFWVKVSKTEHIVVHLVNVAQTNRIIIQDMRVWDRYLEDVWRQSYTEEPTISWGKTMDYIWKDPSLTRLFQRFQIQLINTTISDNDIRIPNMFRCLQSRELAFAYSHCNGVADCLDGSDEMCSYNNLYTEYIHLNSEHWETPVRLRAGDQLDSATEFTLCWAVRDAGIGPLLTYGYKLKTIAVYLEGETAVKVTLGKYYVVFFDMKGVARERDLNRLCLRLKESQLTLYVNSRNITKRSNPDDVEMDDPFGGGVFTIFYDTAVQTELILGEIFSLAVWDYGLSDDLMSVYTSVDRCISDKRAVVKWEEVITEVRLQKPNFIKPSSLCSKEGIDSFLRESTEFDTLHFDYFHPSSTSNDDLFKADISYKSLAGISHKKNDGPYYLMNVGQQICFTFEKKNLNLKVRVVLAVDDNNTVSLRHFTINNQVYRKLCVSCRDNVIRVDDVYLGQNISSRYDLCIMDQRDHYSQISSIPNNMYNGLRITRIVAYEDQRGWTCPKQVLDEHLYGKFVWNPSNSISTAICPLGSLINNNQLAYAERTCDVSKGQWGKKDLKKCNHVFDINSLEDIIESSENETSLLTGDDIIAGVKQAIKSPLPIELHVMKGAGAIMEYVYNRDKDKSNVCWFLKIFDLQYFSKRTEMIQAFKRKFFNVISGGGFGDRICQFSGYTRTLTRLPNMTVPWILHCFAEDHLVLKCVNDSESSREAVVKLGVTILITANFSDTISPLNITLTVLKDHQEGKSGRRFYANVLHTASNDRKVYVTPSSWSVLIVNHSPVSFSAKLRFYNQTGTYERAYCAREVVGYDKEKQKEANFWTKTDIHLMKKTNREVVCDGVAENQMVALLKNSADEYIMIGFIYNIAMAAEILIILLLLVTAAVSAGRVHACAVTGKILSVMCIVYSAYYIVHLFSLSALEHTTFCKHCGALQIILQHMTAFLMFCAGASIHTTVQNRYDVPWFLLKSVILSFSLSAVILVCGIIADRAQTLHYMSLFATFDTDSDFSPRFCAPKAPERYGLVLVPQFLPLTALCIGMSRLKSQILNESIDTDSTMRTSQYLSLVDSVLSVAVIYIINVTFSTITMTSNEQMVQLAFFGVNVIQSALVFYFVSIHCTKVTANLYKAYQDKKSLILAEIKLDNSDSDENHNPHFDYRGFYEYESKLLVRAAAESAQLDRKISKASSNSIKVKFSDIVETRELP